MVKTTKFLTTSATKKSTSIAKPKRKIIHAKELSKVEEKSIIRLYNELVPDDETGSIDVQMIVTEAFPKFEETIGKEAFDKVKRYFGIGCKSNSKSANEIRSLIAKLRTIENAQYYIVGYKELVKKMAEKLYNAPEGMTELEKAKVMRMFFIVFANNDMFLEDHILLPNGKNEVRFSEAQALANNKLIFRPEELFNIFNMKVKYSDGYYYDMMIIHFKRMYLDYHKHKLELSELLEFAELKYDAEKCKFTSVNRCMPAATFAKIRNLKQRIHQVRGAYPMELFCNRKAIKEKVDITDLYVIYKTLVMYPWKKEAKTKMQKYRTLSGSRFLDKQQTYYEVLDNFLIADEAESERWIALFKYVAEYELILKTEFNGNAETLPEPKFYNAGVLAAVLNYAMEIGYINNKTMVIRDFEVANKLLALEGAEEKFLKLKRNELKVEDMRTLLGIDEEFENNVLQLKKFEEAEVCEEQQTMLEKESPEESVVNPLVQRVIQFALDNGYVKSEADINVGLIENVFIPNNEENIKKLSNSKINDSEFEKRIGFEDEFAEAYFNTSKIDIKEVEAKLQDIKRYGKKEQIGKSKLLIALYCYLVKNGIACGPKNKPAKRNKGLKPEILEKLIS